MVGVTDNFAPGMHVPVIVFTMAAYPVGIVHPVNPAAGRIVALGSVMGWALSSPCGPGYHRWPPGGTGRLCLESVCDRPFEREQAATVAE